MKAVVLVGGEGTRLRPLTETIPKPLVHFMNRPFLDHVLDHLTRSGVEEAILSSSYLEEEFRSYLEGRGERPEVVWVTEPQPLGTSGAIVGARDLLDGTFLVLNGDVLTDLDLDALIAFHRRRRALATIALTSVDDARPFGLVQTDPDGRVVAFREKPAQRIPGDINAGTYVLEPDALEGIPSGVPVSIELQTFPELITRGEPVYARVSPEYWMDLGTRAAYVQAHADALAGRIDAYRGTSGPLLADGAVVDPGARLGRYAVLGVGARIEAAARVDRSILHAGASVEAEARVTGSVLGPRSVVGRGARVHDAVLAEGARVPDGAHLEGGGVRPGQVAAR
jgi:NDP-sugar pyrophosphorylase family protein